MRRISVRLAAALLLVTTVVAVPGRASAAIVFTQDFESGTAHGWQFTGGQWAVSTDGSRVLRQSRSGPGTARAGAGDATWRGYTLTARVKPTSLSGPQAAIGILARAGTESGYDLALRSGNRVELARVAAGQRTVLATAGLTLRTGRWYALSLRADGDQLQASVSGPSGAVTLTATDATSEAGAIALFTERAAAAFDDIGVDTIDPPRDTQPPSAPGQPQLLDVTPTTATITWPAATDNVGVTGYIIYFGSQFYEDWTLRQVTGNQPVTLPLGNTTGASLHYSVRAVDAARNQSPMGPRVFFPQPPSFPRTPGDTVPPTAPGAPVVTGTAEAGLVITWAPAGDNIGVVEYHVVHSLFVDEQRVRVKVPGNVTSAVVPPASFPNQVWIVAYDASWNPTRGPAVTLALPTTPAPG